MQKYSTYWTSSKIKYSFSDFLALSENPPQRGSAIFFPPIYKIFQVETYKIYMQDPIAYKDKNHRSQCKMRHLKNLSVEGLCGKCLSEFIDWR